MIYKHNKSKVNVKLWFAKPNNTRFVQVKYFLFYTSLLFSLCSAVSFNLSVPSSRKIQKEWQERNSPLFSWYKDVSWNESVLLLILPPSTLTPYTLALSLVQPPLNIRDCPLPRNLFQWGWVIFGWIIAWVNLIIAYFCHKLYCS